MSYMFPPSTPPSDDSIYTHQYEPPTPRYGPMDEPDLYMVRGKKITGKSEEGGLIDSSRPMVRRRSLMPTVGTMVPLTPAQTPARKRKNIEVIQGTSSSQGHTSRVLFPVHTSKIGSGRIHTTPTSSNITSISSTTTSSNNNNNNNNNENSDLLLPPSLVLSASSSKRALPSPPTIQQSSNIYKSPNTLKRRRTPMELDDSFGSSSSSSSSSVIRPKPATFRIFDDAKAFKAELDNIDDDNLAQQSHKIQRPDFASMLHASRAVIQQKQKNPERITHGDDEALDHPHRPLNPDNTPGMWYTFRGKQVFRPFAQDDKMDRIKPRLLFSKKAKTIDVVGGTTGAIATTTNTTATKPKGSFMMKMGSLKKSSSSLSSAAVFKGDPFAIDAGSDLSNSSEEETDCEDDPLAGLVSCSQENTSNSSGFLARLRSSSVDLSVVSTAESKPSIDSGDIGVSTPPSMSTPPPVSSSSSSSSSSSASTARQLFRR